ncbi:MAG: HAMP domain-containing sensor histidine kinase [Propionicimonas sp.]
MTVAPPPALVPTTETASPVPPASTVPTVSPVPPVPTTPLGAGTLSRQLVRRTTALVAFACVALSLFTGLATYQILANKLDEQLNTAVGRAPRLDTRTGPGDLAGSGLIRLDFTSDGNGFQQSPVTLSDEALSVLMSVEESPNPVTLVVPHVGLYRVLARTVGDRTSVVALPYSEVSKPLTSQLIMAGVLTLGAIGLSFVGARRVVERSLRPLNRLAATANQVSSLPLESGEGIVPIRVGPADANPASEVGQVGLAFNRMLDHVEDALAARHQSETKVRQFVADASHELRNPLAAIRGYAELTRRSDQDLPPDAGHALNRIESESDRMSALVEDLLLLARLDSEPTLDLQPTDVTEIVLNAVSDARAASPDHSWAMNLPEEVVMSQADSHRLHQVIANLLANARTHTPPGTRVEVGLRSEPGWAVITISDNGPGVPEAIRDSVFERFTRAEASRVRHEGGSSTGLGLAIVAAVVGAHRGRVSLDSGPGATTFTVRIPAA